MTCPCCNASLTEAQVKTIWAQFCSSRVRTPGGGAKPWAKHSERAGKKCRCVDCNKLRAIRLQQLEDLRPNPAPDEDDLTWEAVLENDPAKGYEALIKHEASKLRAQRRNKLARKASSEKFYQKMKLYRKRAEKEGVLATLMAQAEARADE